MSSHVEYDSEARTFDCAPTLTDSQVLEFCRDGHLLLEGVVPDEINQKCCDYLDGKIPLNPFMMPPGLTMEELERIRDSHEPSSILLEEWFIKHVLLNPQLAGALRSLLGAGVGLPVITSHHLAECPMPAQGWHQDADHIFGPELKFLEVFYFPQDTPAGMGPTEVFPGTHIGPAKRDFEEQGILLEGPAGTIGIHHQSILHRRGVSTSTGRRRMLKYNYWRSAEPQRDWIVEDDFDFHTAYYGGHRTAIFVAHMFYWLCGRDDDYRVIGGQAWPWRTPQQVFPSMGYNAKEGYRPDWRRTGPDTFAL